MTTPIDPDPPGLADSLDITGDWTITYSWAPEQEPVPGRLPTYNAHFEVTSPGDHGGVKFKGPFVDDPTAGGLPHSHAPTARQPGVFYGETFYDGRGVHLVQMVMYYDVNRYYQLHSGRHMSGVSPVEVDGAYVDVGASRNTKPPSGQGYFGRFRMHKF